MPAIIPGFNFYCISVSCIVALEASETTDCAWQHAGPPKLGHGMGDGFDQDMEQAKLNCRCIASVHICYTTFLDVGFGF